MGNHFSVISLKACEICATDLTTRQRRYCSKKCRDKHFQIKYQPQRSIWQRERNDSRSVKRPNTIECLICHKWYRQVGSHIFNRHEMTAREYRQEYGFDVKRGQLPPDLRECKADHVKTNGTVNNLKKGAKYRFKKGQPHIGDYIRSEQTMQRLKGLNKFNKHNGNKRQAISTH